MNSYLKSEIGNRIKGKVAIVGLGNIIRGDDALGPKLIELAKAKPVSNAALFDCGTAPENYIFPILSSLCDTIVLVDAADLGRAPGEIEIFDLDRISRVSFSTHNPSPHLFIDLLKTGREGLNIFVVSVQPKGMSLGSQISEEVMQGLNLLVDAFSATIG